MIQVSWLLAFSLLGITSATKAVLTKTDQQVPGNVTVFSIDLEAGTSKAIASLEKDWTVLSGGVVCGGVYYAAFTHFVTMSCGLLSVDLKSASPEITVLSTNSLWHQLSCDPQSPKSVLGVASDSAMVVDKKANRLQPGNGASFHLKRYTAFPVANETYVATFPAKEVVWGGQDGIFSFKADGSEVWASWPADGCPDCSPHKGGGHLHVMDTTTGSIKKSVKIHSSLLTKTNPYFLVPDAMRGVFDPGRPEGLFWADLTLTDDALTWKKAEAAADMWSSSQPKENCHGNLLAPQEHDGMGATTILLINPKDGSQLATFDPSTIKAQGSPVYGAAACDETTYAGASSAQVMV